MLTKYLTDLTDLTDLTSVVPNYGVCYHILVTWDTLHIRREFRYKGELPGAALWASSVHLMKGAGAWLVVSKLRENTTLQLTLGE